MYYHYRRNQKPSAKHVREIAKAVHFRYVLILLFILFIEFDFENPENVAKSKEIEKLLEDYESVSVEEWQRLAKSKGGLLSGNQ